MTTTEPTPDNPNPTPNPNPPMTGRVRNRMVEGLPAVRVHPDGRVAVHQVGDRWRMIDRGHSWFAIDEVVSRERGWADVELVPAGQGSLVERLRLAHRRTHPTADVAPSCRACVFDVVRDWLTRLGELDERGLWTESPEPSTAAEPSIVDGGSSRPAPSRACVCQHFAHSGESCGVLDCGCSEYQPQPAGSQTISVVQAVTVCDACASLIETTVRRLTAERDQAAKAERDRIVQACRNQRRAAWENDIGQEAVRFWSAMAGWVRHGATAEPDVRGDAPAEDEELHRQLAASRAEVDRLREDFYTLAAQRDEWRNTAYLGAALVGASPSADPEILTRRMRECGNLADQGALLDTDQSPASP